MAIYCQLKVKKWKVKITRDAETTEYLAFSTIVSSKNDCQFSTEVWQDIYFPAPQFRSNEPKNSQFVS